MAAKMWTQRFILEESRMIEGFLEIIYVMSITVGVSQYGNRFRFC